MHERNILITGASLGIGKVTARRFAEAGFRVFGTSRRLQPDESGVEMLELDLRSPISIENCVAEVLSRAGSIDVLVNNAGVMHWAFAEETTMEEAHALFETNFFGPAQMMNAVLPLMRKSRRGRIINVGSLAAWLGEPGEAYYSASKRALAGLTESVRHEVWPLGIHVSLIEPGVFQTRVLEDCAKGEPSIADYDGSRRSAWRTLERSLQNGGDPRKVAELILKVALARKPRFRYGVGPEARWLPFVKVALPQRLFDHLLRRGYGLRKAADLASSSTINTPQE